MYVSGQLHLHLRLILREAQPARQARPLAGNFTNQGQPRANSDLILACLTSEKTGAKNSESIGRITEHLRILNYM